MPANPCPWAGLSPRRSMFRPLGSASLARRGYGVQSSAVRTDPPRALLARLTLTSSDFFDVVSIGGALACNWSGRDVRFARVTEEDRACARRERFQNRAGGFQHGMPAVRVEHDARVEIAAVVDERWTVAANEACAGAHGAPSASRRARSS